MEKGERFGRLVAVSPVRLRTAHPRWLFRCDCGTHCFKDANDVRRGSVKSCGCLRRLTTSVNRTTHGCSTENSRIYRIWRGMKTRCNNPNFKQWSDYGGRGIRVCIRWQRDFVSFRDWALTNGYRDDLSIDRRNNDHGYRPSNCRWATPKEQQANKRRPRVAA